MATKTYHGSCHCGAVRYEADIDLAAGTGKCNCSYCTKVRTWGVGLKPDAFRLLAGADALAGYQFGSHSAHHRFCRTCGIHPYAEGRDPKGNEMRAINIRCLEGIDLEAVPVTHFDGRSK